MLAFLMRRVVATLPVLVVVAAIVFLMTRLAPGDPAAAMLGDNATAENVQKVRAQLGLDDSIAVQFVRWGSHMVRGDLGQSYIVKMPVSRLIAQRIEPTISLAAITLVFTLAVAIRSA